MHYKLRDGLSFCSIDGHAIFMDLPADRYFELPLSLENSFNEILRNGPVAVAHAKRLEAQDIIKPTDQAPMPIAEPTAVTCRRSAMERCGNRVKPTIAHAIEVAGLVLTTSRWLKNRRLSTILDGMVLERISSPRQEDVPSLLDATAAFLWARLHVPVETSCLLDTLSLCRFLTRRGLPWSIVFGVTRYPFAAHCWVQVNDLALNDTVGNVAAHTPIRVV